MGQIANEAAINLIAKAILKLKQRKNEKRNSKSIGSEKNADNQSTKGN